MNIEESSRNGWVGERGIDVNGKTERENQIRSLNGVEGKWANNLLDSPITPLPLT